MTPRDPFSPASACSFFASFAYRSERRGHFLDNAAARFSFAVKGCTDQCWIFEDADFSQFGR